MPLFVRILSAEGRPIEGLSGPVAVKGYEGWSRATDVTMRLSRGGNTAVLREDAVQQQAEEMEKFVEQMTEQQEAQSKQLVKSRFGSGSSGGLSSDVGKIARAGASRWQATVRAAGPTMDRNDAVGPPVFDVVRLGKSFDRTSAGIFRWCAREAVNDESVIASKRIIEAHVVRRKAGSDDFAPTVTMRFEECLPSSYDCEFNDGSELPEETIEFRTSKVKIEFREFGADGREASDGRRSSEFSQKDVGA
ncbi:MAG: hypothetical protein K8T90_15190 [Planctomycetes bacterium]|nr:hypothetical protein [Planctomycetota bacterium]